LSSFETNETDWILLLFSATGTGIQELSACARLQIFRPDLSTVNANITEELQDISTNLLMSSTNIYDMSTVLYEMSTVTNDCLIDTDTGTVGMCKTGNVFNTWMKIVGTGTGSIN
jgi:hypothetical protein